VFEGDEPDGIPTPAETTAGGGMRLVDLPTDDDNDPAPIQNAWANQAAKAQARTTGNHGKRGRASMPSWDEIVFGARTDDDLA
jgi:hypothetical protein